MLENKTVFKSNANMCVHALDIDLRIQTLSVLVEDVPAFPKVSLLSRGFRKLLYGEQTYRHRQIDATKNITMPVVKYAVCINEALIPI